MSTLSRMILKSRQITPEAPWKVKDVIEAQKELVLKSGVFLPLSFIAFLKVCNGLEGADSAVLGIPPVKNERLNIINFNAQRDLPEKTLILGYDDFCFLVYDDHDKLYKLTDKETGMILESFEETKWEDALLSIIHIDDV